LDGHLTVQGSRRSKRWAILSTTIFLREPNLLLFGPRASKHRVALWLAEALNSVFSARLGKGENTKIDECVTQVFLVNDLIDRHL
jgi:hypothetical protein